MTTVNLKTKEEVNTLTRKTIKRYYPTTNLAEQIHQLANQPRKVKMMILILQIKVSVEVRDLYKCKPPKKGDKYEIIINND